MNSNWIKYGAFAEHANSAGLGDSIDSDTRAQAATSKVSRQCTFLLAMLAVRANTYSRVLVEYADVPLPSR